MNAIRALCVLVITGVLALAEETVEVKPLTETQQAALAKAKAKLEAAQAEYEATVDGIKAAHGIYPSGISASLADCYSSESSAEIAGKHIIIRQRTHNVCDGFFVNLPAPIK